MPCKCIFEHLTMHSSMKPYFMGLKIATALSIRRLMVLGDSMLVINHANKEWSCLDDKMIL
jgi:hypothetical protein